MPPKVAGLTVSIIRNGEPIGFGLIGPQCQTNLYISIRRIGRCEWHPMRPLLDSLDLVRNDHVALESFVMKLVTYLDYLIWSALLEVVLVSLISWGKCGELMAHNITQE